MRTGRDRVTVNGHEPAFGAEVFRTLVFSTRPVSLEIGASANGKFNYSARKRRETIFPTRLRRRLKEAVANAEIAKEKEIT